MPQYINKDALVAKIKKRINNHQIDMYKCESIICKAALQLCIEEDEVILSFLGILKVKEVDLEK